MASRSKKFVFLCLALTPVIIAATLLTRYAVDAYGLYSGQRDTIFYSHARLVKPWIVYDKSIPNILIGNSRSLYAVKPKAPLGSEAYVYNASIAGLKVYETYRLLKHAHYCGAGRQNVYLCLDYIYQPDIANEILSPPFTEIDLLQQSPDLFHPLKRIRHLFKRAPSDLLTRKAYYEENGYRKFAAFNFETHGFRPAWEHQERNDYGNFSKATPDAALTQLIGRTLRFSYENELPLTLFISPRHIRNYIAADLESGWDYFFENQRIIAETNEALAKEYGKEPYRFVIFSTVNDYSTERVPWESNEKDPMRYWYESSHMKPTLGEYMLSELNMSPISHDKFGVEVTSENLPAFQDRFRQQTRRYMDRNPEIVQQVRDILSEIAADSEEGGSFQTAPAK